MREPKARKTVEISLAPLIDVVLILVIFVMASASFTERRNLAIDVPESVQGEADTSPALVVGLQRNGVVLLDGERIDRARVTEVLRTRFRVGARVVIEAQRDVELHALVQVLDAARDAGFDDTAIAVDRPRGAQP